MNTLKIKTTFAEATEALGDAEFRRLIRGMLKYASSGETPDLPGNERILWPTVKEDIDEQLKSFNRRSAANKKNITKRYEPLPTPTNGRNSYELVEQRKAEESGKEGEEKSAPLEPPVKENPPEKGKEGEKKNTPRAKKAFTPPTLDEVRAYVAERSSPVDPVEFWEYFQTGHWIDSEGKPVQAWKQKLLTWEHHQKNRPAPRGKTGGQVQASCNFQNVDLSDLRSMMKGAKS